MRTLLGGIVGGAVVFVCSFALHMLTPLGDMGLSQLPQEEKVLAALQPLVTAPGFYFFPGPQGERKDPAVMEAWEARMLAGPIGLLVYQPHGRSALAPRYFITEFVSNVAAALLAALVLARVTAWYPVRVALVGFMGLFAWFSISVSHWNWYGFPDMYTLAEGIDQALAWTAAGLVMATIVKPCPGRAAPLPE